RLQTLTSVYGIVLGVAGWYYLRNWWLLGTPFVGGGAPERGISWGREPRYTSWDQFVRFGGALVYPIYAGVASFWEAFYSSFWLDSWLSSIVLFRQRPPWNYNFILSGAWFGILPTLAIVLGAVAAFRRLPSSTALGVRFALGCVAVYVIALLT